ncbi:MAG: DNA methyltransferase [Acidobacteria bacterium]|nr:DNA methyltransferase [Acidobacteriota bacterium]
MNVNTLYYGDCLDWMEQWPDRSVDLIYLDPPFNSNADYNMLYSSAAGGAQYRAFNDTWYWDEGAAERYDVYQGAPGRPAHSAVMGMAQIFGRSGMLAYLTYMAERLEQMHRLLRPTGSIYLHCDPTASHGLKLLMDSIFGQQNFRNEIVWYYYNKMHDRRKKMFAAAADSILFYVKDRSSDFPFTQLRERREKPIKQLVRRKKDGRMVNARDEQGNLIYQTRTHRTIDNVWRLPCLQPAAKERLGYPTQKPLSLLERIIEASSNPGDLVLDPFCGCGTAIEAAHKLKRGWVGIDISSFAIDLIRSERMKGMKIPTKGIPQDVASARKMAREQPFAFESWAVTRLPGFAPNTKQVADGGVDGRAMLAEKPEDFDSRLALAQVKGGKFSLSGLRDFTGVVKRDQAAVGCFVTLEPVNTPAARAEVAGLGKIRVGGRDFRRMSLWPVSDYFDRRLPVLPSMTDPYTGRPMAPSLFR